MFLQLLVAGIANGALYAVMAFGFVLVFNVGGWLHFPQGMYSFLGAFIALTLMEVHLPLPAAAVLAIIATTVVGVVLARTTIVRMRQPEFNAAVLIMCGLGFLYQGIMQVAFGKYPKAFPFFSKTWSLDFGGASIATQSLWLIGITVLLGIALWYFFGRHLYGKAMRATTQNPLGAKLVGINILTMTTLSVGLAAGIGALAGIAVAPLAYVVYDAGWLYTMKGLVAAVLGGGLVSYSGAFVGGLVVGLIESFTIGYLTSSYKDVVLFSILIIILLLRPAGILGKGQATYS
jgi:branched-chain amino acid transport system permease protein